MKKILLDFWEENKNKAQPFDWLQGRSYSEAFVICIGAGPWKFNRRKAIQGQALEYLNGRDLLDVSTAEANHFYPLDWQNNFICTTIENLQRRNSLAPELNFQGFCEGSISAADGLRTMREMAGTKNAKVISLFCRDALKVPSFPIDRHVKRKLHELGLPTNEDKIITICNDAGIDPRKVAVAFVRTASNMDNPDWSIK